ncbi:MAG: nucleotide exchange factor GrpE [Phycisphaerales bacterium]|nr:nucleotide exchange factor GrpE [Phycisphaerales bacterium]
MSTEMTDQDAMRDDQEAANEAMAEAASPIEAAQAEIDRLRAENLRLLAEMQNMQKRVSREKEESLRYAAADFARQLLTVIDDLDKARETARDASEVAPMAKAIEIVHDNFLKALQSLHIQPIEAVGKPFDPAYHEALMQQPTDEHPPGTVIGEVSRGFKMHERVVRPTRVIVASEPPKS